MMVIDSLHKIKIGFSKGFQMLTDAGEGRHVVWTLTYYRVLLFCIGFLPLYY